MWFIPNSTANIKSGKFASINPLKRNIAAGIIESDNAFNLPFLFRQITQNIRYNRHKTPFAVKYAISA